MTQGRSCRKPMIEASSTKDSLPQHVVSDLGGVSPEAETWLHRLFLCFPVPRRDSALHLIGAVSRVMTNVPWVLDLLDEDEFLRPGGRVIELTKKKFPGLRLDSKTLKADFGGDFLLTGALLVPTGARAPPGIEALRAVALVCQWRWVAQGSARATAIDTLLTSIRNVASAGTEFQKLVRELGASKDLDAFLGTGRQINPSVHRALAEIWGSQIEPALRGIAATSSKPSALAPSGAKAPPVGTAGLGGEPRWLGGTPPPRSPPRSRGGRARVHSPTATTEDELIEKLQGQVRLGTGTRPESSPAPLPGEPLEEVAPNVLTSPLPAAPSNADARSILRHQVRQAIWSTNHLLLPNHPDVLPLVDYARVVRGILELLDSPSLDIALRGGVCGLLVQALTGRTPKTLRALTVRECLADGHDPNGMGLLLKEQAFRLSCFWRVSESGRERSVAMVDDKLAPHLEAVRGDFLLLLAPSFAEQLVRHAAALRELLALPQLEMESGLRKAARQVVDATGVAFLVGQLRSSFAPHLHERCRDVAATQLICADTLGQSVAPLYYYAPRASHLARMHWGLQQDLLGTEDQLPPYPLADGRVGTHLLVRVNSAQAMARAPSRLLHHGIARLVDEGRLVDLHRAMLCHLAGMLLSVATHRPSQALMALTMSDIVFEKDSGAALFRDKVHDAAHAPRLVALPPTLCRQLSAYREHLVGLSGCLPALGPQVGAILRGKAPLLMDLSVQGRLEPLDLAGLKALMPPEWQVAPLNWGRHWMRTHALERGLRPELVNMQLGHLEAVGYPFSGASPTEPWRFVAEIASGWDQLARDQGWQVVHGLRGDTPLEREVLPPLQAWGRIIADHEIAQRAEAKEWRMAMRAKMRTYRELAERTVLENTELIRSGVVDRYRDRQTGQHPLGLTRSDFERIRDEAYVSAGDDLALAIACANAVCRVARVVNARSRQSHENPGEILVLRRPLDNAFFPGMMDAVRQVTALREHVRSLAEAEPRIRWADPETATACAVLALALFGPCHDPGQIRGAIERRNELQRSAVMQDVVVVPWGDLPHQVMGLRGVAAIVLARLKWKRGGEVLPDWKGVEERLADLLPAWARGEPGSPEGRQTRGLVERICETVAVALRYELSPAARLATGSVRGSTPAHMLEQLAMIDGDPAGTVLRTWEATDGALSPRGTLKGAAESRGNARSQYLALCAVFPDSRKETDLTLTKVTIPSGQAAATGNRSKVVAEITARLDERDPPKCLRPIVRMLASWVVDLIEHGTPNRSAPRLSTVEGYLTRIGAPLVEIFGQSSMNDVSEAELEEAYLTSIESKPTKGKLRQRSAAAVLLFHRFAQVQFGLPEIDLSEVMLHMRDDSDALADARLILPKERAAMMSLLARRARTSDGSSDGRDARAARLACHAAPLFGYGGLRRGEGLGLQFRDITEGDGGLRFRIRQNNSRRLKTTSGRRVIEVPTEATSVDGVTLADWVGIERKRLRKQRLETAFIFTPTDDSSDATVREDIAEALLEASREVTGRRRSRLHSLRHLVATESITPVFLNDRDRDLLSGSLDLAVLHESSSLALPRDLLRQVIRLGHADPKTTLISYHHLPWLLRSYSDARLASSYLNRQTLAPLLGVSIHALNQALKSRPLREHGLAWLDVALDVREIPQSPSVVFQEQPPEEESRAADIPQWRAMELGAVLDDVARVGSLEKVLLVRGAALTEAAALRRVIHPMERRLGRRLLEERGRPAAPGSPRTRVRRLGSARKLELLLDRFDRDLNGQRQSIATLAEATNEYLHPVHGDRIHLPSAQMKVLRGLLAELGLSGDQIIREPDEHGLEVTRIRRVGLAAGSDKPGNQQGAGRGAKDHYLGFALKRVLLIVRLAVRLV